MSGGSYDMEGADIAWCPGCGNFQILDLVKDVLARMELDPTQVVMVSGIGQAAKIPHYIRTNVFNGLHGRALPPATAIKAVNPTLTVIAESGDGDMYGEGGNHFIHTIRRNPDIVNIVHDNMVYGLTQGQASPTSREGFVTPVQVEGVILEPFNPLAVASALRASFVARIYCGDREHASMVLERAIKHKGYALVDILQPCVTYNKVNTYKWYKEHTYKLDDDHDPSDRVKAFSRAIEEDPLPLGIFYEEKDRPSFEKRLIPYQDDDTPIVRRMIDRSASIARLLRGYG